MTVDELTALTAGLLNQLGFTMANIRDPSGADRLASLDDDMFLIAVRFMAGERPEISTPHNTPQAVSRPASRQVSGTDIDWDAIEHEDEIDGARYAPDVRGAGDVARKVDLGDGVTLGI